MPLLLIKFGPWIAIALLLGLLSIDHYRLLACESQRHAADAANKSFELDNAIAAQKALKEHKDLLYEIRTEQLLQGVINSQSLKMDKSIRIQLSHPPKGDCHQLFDRIADTLGGKK
ncbi:MAG: hypothetical protein GJU73_12580 [Ferrovum sp.]|jgi:hypothetical protein|uniref:hypothetical protein n=1 Tax=Ferrovum sp. TaxID=2609467 RepID=UPI002612C60A|nr:hypothetical protein [Ferrovum sp.]MBW8068259.1 hypothetical protein [Ferrovum sp.]